MITKERKLELIKKSQTKNVWLTKEESEELGPLSNQDLTITGDAFIDHMLGVSIFDSELA